MLCSDHVSSLCIPTTNANPLSKAVPPLLLLCMLSHLHRSSLQRPAQGSQPHLAACSLSTFRCSDKNVFPLLKHSTTLDYAQKAGGKPCCLFEWKRKEDFHFRERETTSKSEPNSPATEYVSIKLADISAMFHQAKMFMPPSRLGKTECQKSNLRKEKQLKKRKSCWWCAFSKAALDSSSQAKHSAGECCEVLKRACLGKASLHGMAPAPACQISPCWEPGAVLRSAVLQMALEGGNTPVSFKRGGRQGINALLYDRTLNAVGIQPQKSVC